MEHILDECFEAGVKEIIFVISKNKDVIKKYFLKNKLLEKAVKNKPDILKKLIYLNQLSKRIKFVYQDKPRGLGHAVICAQKYIKSKYFLLLLPDDIIKDKNCTKELITINKKNQSSVLALKQVSKRDVKRYGIAGFSNKKKFKINRMIEKPSISNAPSRFAIIGRYLLSKSIFKFLRKQKSGKLGEIQITDAMNAMLSKESFYGCKFKGKYLDCGTIDGYTKSFVEINK